MFKETIEINKQLIGRNQKPFVIAELSGNHGHSLAQVKKMMLSAKKAGASAVKLQTLRPNEITLDSDNEDFFIKDKNNPWYGQTMFELYSKSYLPWEWYPDIFKFAEDNEITCFSTPFDIGAIDFLEGFNVPCYKIGSSENNDIALIRKAASTKKPLMISLGMASLSDIEQIIEVVSSEGCQELILMICTACYPAPISEIHLRTIPHLRQMFNINVGFSDHTLGIGAAIASVALEAVVIEKHFKLSDSVDALDGCFSSDEKQFELMVNEINNAWNSMGQIHYGTKQCETQYLNNRRSLYVSKDVSYGEILTTKNVQSVRPSHGLPPKYLDKILGKKATAELKKGDRLSWDKVGQ